MMSTMMSERVSADESGTGEALAAETVPLSLRAELREAFREWLAANKAWVTLNRAIEANGDSSTARRKLKELDERLDAAAEAFEQTQQRLSDSHFFTLL
jgi:hypothetical protein